MTDRTKELLRIWISRSSICSNVNAVNEYHADLAGVLGELSKESLNYDDLLSELDNIEPSLCERQEDLDKLAKIIYMLLTYYLEQH